MTKLDDFFEEQTEPLHPRLRSWKDRLGQSGTSAALEVDFSHTGFGQYRPEMHLHFARNGTALTDETLMWDDELNSGLIHQMPDAVRAVNEAQEAERFALGLRAAFRRPEIEFGDGYFNSVILDLIGDGELKDHPTIAGVLPYVHALPANRERNDYRLCREMIEGAITGRALELTGPLGYSRVAAKNILVSALARYLDLRFSVASRRQAGWIGT